MMMFRTLCLFHLHRQVGVGTYLPIKMGKSVPKCRQVGTGTYLPTKMERTECSEMLAYKIQTLGNFPEESIQHSEHGKSLKSWRQETCLLAYSYSILNKKNHFSRLWNVNGVHEVRQTDMSDEPLMPMNPVAVRLRLIQEGCNYINQQGVI